MCAGPESYPTLFALAGDNARDFLTRIGRVHAQATLSISGVRPPELMAEDLPDGALAIHYVSERRLCPVVHGLILGVGIYFGQQLSVTQTRCMRNGYPECLFAVRFS